MAGQPAGMRSKFVWENMGRRTDQESEGAGLFADAEWRGGFVPCSRSTLYRLTFMVGREVLRATFVKVALPRMSCQVVDKITSPTRCSNLYTEHSSGT